MNVSGNWCGYSSLQRVAAQLGNSGAGTAVNEYLSKKFPGVAVVTNELIESWKNSEFTSSFQNWLNSQLSSGGVKK